MEHVDSAVRLGRREVGIDGRPQPLAVLDGGHRVDRHPRGHRRRDTLGVTPTAPPSRASRSSPATASSASAAVSCSTSRPRRSGSTPVAPASSSTAAATSSDTRRRWAGPISEYRTLPGARTARMSIWSAVHPRSASAIATCPRARFVTRARHGQDRRHQLEPASDGGRRSPLIGHPSAASNVWKRATTLMSTPRIARPRCAAPATGPARTAGSRSPSPGTRSSPSLPAAPAGGDHASRPT